MDYNLVIGILGLLVGVIAGKDALLGIFKRLDISWKVLGKGVDSLQDKLVLSNYKPDLILGVSGGGVAIADMLSVRLGTSQHKRPAVVSINWRKHYATPGIDQPASTDLATLGNMIKGKKVLLVEDFFFAVMRLGTYWTN